MSHRLCLSKAQSVFAVWFEWFITNFVEKKNLLVIYDTIDPKCVIQK